MKKENLQQVVNSGSCQQASLDATVSTGLVRIVLQFIQYKINEIMFPFTADLLLSRIVLTNVSVELQGCDAQPVSPPSTPTSHQ